MSRSGYSDECDNLQLYRGAVVSAIRGKRGQQLLRDLAEAMDAMPVKELIAEELQSGDRHCALGVVGVKRGIDMTGIHPEQSRVVANTFNISKALAQEIVYVNDECGPYGGDETPAQRWTRVRKWVADAQADAYSAF